MARAFSHSHRPQVFKNLDESLNKHRLAISCFKLFFCNQAICFPVSYSIVPVLTSRTNPFYYASMYVTASFIDTFYNTQRNFPKV